MMAQPVETKTILNARPSVRDVTWMSALSMHLAKWIDAQVTDSHLVKCPHQQSVPNF